MNMSDGKITYMTIINMRGTTAAVSDRAGYIRINIIYIKLQLNYAMFKCMLFQTRETNTCTRLK